MARTKNPKPKAEPEAKTEPAHIGRPSVFTQATADEICTRLMGGETLRQIVRDEHMPARSTVHKWLNENKAFSDQYAQAREYQADTIFDELFEIADDGSNDFMLRKQGDDEVEVVNHEHIQRSRLRIDTRKWALARMSPKKYGDKTAIVGGDPETDEPLQIDDSRGLGRKLAFILAGALDQKST